MARPNSTHNSTHGPTQFAQFDTLTPELEASIRRKVKSGYYNNASEVIRAALRFWENNEELVQHIKLEALQKRLAIGAGQAGQGKFIEQSVSDIITEAKNA